MTRLLSLRNSLQLGAMLGWIAFTAVAKAQTPGAPTGLPQGVTREQMWFPPTAEDWKKPCLVQWQRTYEDALAVSKETGKPILICVNMDGEPASEHYAGVRYRRPETADLYKPYVCVIASVYRHTPRDYDDQGNRILCPRFGSVTCGEHIAIEPGLYDKYFDGKRVAPRHIGVDLEKSGAEMYDVYYAFDTDTIFNALRDGVANRPAPPPVSAHSDRPVVERVDSPDNEDRTAVELAYSRGDAAQRRALLEVALQHAETASVDLLRLAVRGLDIDLAQIARRALAKNNSESAIDLIAEALRVPMESSERDALIAALARFGETSQRARTLATVYQGLADHTSVVDVATWSKAIEGESAPAPAIDSYALGARLEARAGESRTHPDDANARTALAETLLELALDTKTTAQYERLAFQDAQRAALEAEKLGATGWSVNATLALAAQHLGRPDEAHARAEAAVKDMPADASAAQSSKAFAVLTLFAEARQQAIAKAWREKTAWPAQWLTDVNATYAVLEHHPLGQDAQVVAHYDFLKWLGAMAQAARVLDDGLARFPESWILHDRLRSRILAEKGVDGLEPTYESMLREKIGWPNLEWFAGYASLTAAEFHKRAGHNDASLVAYERAMTHYENALATNPESRASVDHYVALALAGCARIAFEQADYERATAQLLASFERKPDAAATLDGLNLSPVDTAKMLLARLKESKRDDLAASLQAALDKLDPELLKLPAYEKEGPSSRPQRRDRQRTDQ